MEEIKKECENILDKICEKFGYSNEDKEGNKSLKTILKQIIPCMLIDANKEERQLFYQMLKHTPIEIVDDITQEKYDELNEKYIGNINPHIVNENEEIGEYGVGVAPGAYVSEPIISEDMKVLGKKSFLYVDKLKIPKEIELLQTDINVSHLIHELGHAWAAEKEEYEMLKDGTLKQRVGTAEFNYKFEKEEDGKFIKSSRGVTGLYLEEAMNTIKEEAAMAKYLGDISKEEISKVYKEILISSTYQGLMSQMVEALLEKTDGQGINNWRITGESSYIENEENMMSKTKYWEDRENKFLLDDESEMNYSRKKSIFSEIGKQRIADFFQKYEDVYFPDIMNMTPMEKIDNVLEQIYNMKTIKYSYNLLDENEKKTYSDTVLSILKEGYALINQTASIKKEIEQNKEMKEIVKDVSLGELNKVTEETKNIVKENSKEKTEEKIVGDNNERQ